MKLDSLEALYIHELKDLHSAESQVLKALPKLAKAAASEKLAAAFEAHAAQTEKQIERIEAALKELNEKPGRTKCKGMEGLLEEGKEMMKEKADPAVKDAALIASAQKVEHYEMAGYGTARTYAEMLGLDDAVQWLQETLEEEKLTDQKLTKLALSEVNPAAV